MKLENKLKKDYTLVCIRIKPEFSYPYSKLSVYKLKNNLKIIINGNSYDCIDFYDFRYRGLKRLEIYGYLLFPEKINNKTKTVRLDLPDTKNQVIWELDKINKIINIFKE